MIVGMDRHALAMIAAASLAPSTGPRGAPSPDHVIRPGIGAGGVCLGMSEGQALRVLGPPDVRIAIDDDDDAAVRLTWAGISILRWDGPGGRVNDISVTDRGIRMVNGVGVGTPLARVRRAFPRAALTSSPLLCVLGEMVPGGAITTLRFSGDGRVSEVGVGRIIR